MKLDSKKVRRLKKLHKLTWQQIAQKTGLKTRQAAFQIVSKERIGGADVFAKLFKLDPRDLIK
jgi:transcriptional regulator with XRE-family HTH domain